MPDRNRNLSAEPPLPAGTGSSGIEVAGLAVGVIWVCAVAIWLAVRPAEGGAWGLIMTGLIVLPPIAMLWVAATLARSVRSLRAEAAQLQLAMNEMRISGAAASNMGSSGQIASFDKRPGGSVAVQRKIDPALTVFTPDRDPAKTVPYANRTTAAVLPNPAMAEDQPGLALGTPVEDLRPPLSAADFIRALNFPESPQDKAGFLALRLALEDRTSAKLIRAAQDVLTLLSQEGIYMDDLRPDPAKPEVWRRFAEGQRGRAVSALGGIRDKPSLALTAARMREDAVFRDAAHHFLRQFDRTFQEFEKNASDQDLAGLAETRTARAFMLFGRVSGTFD